MASYAGWDAASLRRVAAAKGQATRRKYGNVEHWVLPNLTVVAAEGEPPHGAIRFHSKREAERFLALRIEFEAGRISDLAVQPVYPLTVSAPGGTRVSIGTYVADFSYVRDGRVVVEDVKGLATPLFKWKAKHFEAEHGYHLQVIR
jgi:hypothetical protein